VRLEEARFIVLRRISGNLCCSSAFMFTAPFPLSLHFPVSGHRPAALESVVAIDKRKELETAMARAALLHHSTLLFTLLRMP
jgi:hypothetical protein